MTAKALRSLLPVLKAMREAGITRFSAGEGDQRVTVEFARPEAPSLNPALPADEDVTAQDDDADGDPRFFLEKFTRDGGYERGGSGT